MQLIPQWNKWHRRFSTWIISLIPVIEVARQHLPELQTIMSPQAYQVAYAGLGIAAVVAMQIKQQSVSGDASGCGP